MNPDDLPLVYLAISPDLFDIFGLADVLAQVEGLARVERWEGSGSPDEAAVRLVAERAEVLVIGWTTPSLVKLLEHWSPERSPLRLVAHTGGTIKHLLPRAALEQGLLAVNANEPMADTVAEYTLGAMLAMRHRMFEAAWRYRAHLPGLVHTQIHELSGSTVGIIGASAIGRRVMDLLRPYHTQILLYDPYCSEEVARSYGARQTSLMELFQQSNIISLHAPVTPETLGMLQSRHFAAMKDGAVFINTARGRMVDHAALLQELQTGRIFCFLDVTDPQEPLPADSPFFNLENCVLIPHIGAASLECRRRQGCLVVDEILAYLQGKPLKHRVDLRRWDTMA